MRDERELDTVVSEPAGVSLKTVPQPKVQAPSGPEKLYRTL